MSNFVKTGTLAGIEEIRRNNNAKLSAYRDQQRERTYSAISGLLSIGKSLWENYSSNTKIIDYAKSKGFDVKTSKFNQIFGTDLEFAPNQETSDRLQKTGINTNNVEWNKQFFLSDQMYNTFQTQKSMLDVLGGL